MMKSRENLVKEIEELRVENAMLKEKLEVEGNLQGIMLGDFPMISATNLRDLIESIPNSIIIVQDGKVVFANSNTSEITGYSMEDIYSKPFWEAIHPDHREMVVSNAKKRLLGKKVPGSYEHKILTKDGEVKWLFTSARITEFQGAKAILATSFDISHKKLVEKHLRSLLENPSGYLIYRTKAYKDSEKIEVIQVSPSFAHVLGIPEEHKYDFEKWFTHIYREDLPGLMAANERGKKPPFKFDQIVRYDKPGEGLKWLEVRATGIPFEDDPEKIEYANGIILDITERKRAEDELKKHRLNLEALVKERTRELEEKGKQLERYNMLFEGREFRIKELRDEIKNLKKQLKKR